MVKIFRLFAFSLLAAFLLFSCRTSPRERTDSNLENAGIRQLTVEGDAGGGIADEIRSLVETGTSASMMQALEIIRSRDIGGTEFGRLMNGIITLIVRRVYPDTLLRLPGVDLPLTSPYTRIIREAERGVYIRPPENSIDFFDYILPFLAINYDSSAETLAFALQDLQIAAQLRPNSVLPPFFQGLIFEQTLRFAEAEAAFRQANVISTDFYPALLGVTRIMNQTGRRQQAAGILSELVINHPDSFNVKRQLAVNFYEDRNWSRAESAVDEILRHNPRDGEFLLMRAHILIEQGNFSSAGASLDIYASINPNNRNYLFLRARLLAEGPRNRDAALNYLRSIIRTNPNDEEALVYAARLLMESPRPEDQSEGRELLLQLQRTAGNSIEVLSLGLRDAVQRESWQEAQGLLNRVLAVRRNPQDLIDAYHVERGLGNNARALVFARELHERAPANNDFLAIFISALIDNGRRVEASGFIESRLDTLAAGPARSQFYFLRSRIQQNDDAALADLRASLFENPRNLDAIIAMFEIHHRRREERRAVHYLRQALAISPDNPRLRPFIPEYSRLLSR